MGLIDLVRRRPTSAAFSVLAIVTVLYPFMFSGRFEIGVGIAVGAMAIGATGFVLLIGFAHQLALGQAAFCMIGGYGSAILSKEYYGVDPFVALVLSMLAAMFVAYLIGTPILRLRGFVLAMASLAFQLILVYLALEMISVTGGAEGTTGVPKFAIFGWTLTSDIFFYALVWLLVAASILVAVNIERSRIGRALKAIAGSEAASGAVGIDIARYKVQMFVVSAGLASITGSVMAHYLRIMDPHVFGFVFSLLLITAVIVGGLMSVWGGVLGAAALVIIREALRGLELPRWEVVIMGALTVVVLIAFRRGVAGAIADIFAKRSKSGSGAPQGFDCASPGIADRAYLPTVDRREQGTILSVQRVSKSFGSLQAVSDVSFEIRSGTISALIGPNGAGKTTLFNLISGFLPLDSGEIRFGKKRIERLPPHQVAVLGISRTFQNLQLFPALTVEENIMCGCHRHARAGLLSVSFHTPGMRREERGIHSSAAAYLKFVGLEDVAKRYPSELPFGHQRLVEIARALATRPQLLIMDEPASGLNDSETERLAELILGIRESGTTVLLVEHDMRLVMGLADEVVVMNYGQKIAAGRTEEVRSDPAVVAAYLGT